MATDLEKPVLLGTNTTDNQHRSLRLRLVGTQSSRDAIGSKIRVTVNGDDEQTVQLTAGDGYESTNERMVEIGIGLSERVSKIEIVWPSSHHSVFTNVASEHAWTAIESSSELVSIPSGH